MKKLFSWSLLFGIALLPFFGGITEASSNQGLLRVSVPWDQGTKQDDVNIKTAGKTSNAVVGNEETLYSTLNLINDYLWWSFGAIAMGLTIYAGYEVITGDGDKKAMKKAQWTLIGVAVGLCIAMLSSAIIKIVVNII
ncbi:MAG: hypothetical protein HG439_003985 [candidate division SR1 bacterium]|nr:hypothetical protein [candidate division SR1 bacterium]MBF0931888.1 hypothetical protein [candidate division SR1 bacterium]RKW21158.1 MAG: hypothetical protein D8B45_06355 [Candidatus Gracilibacteria bacterium]